MGRRKSFCLFSVLQPPAKATVILFYSLSFRWVPLLKAACGQSLCAPVGLLYRGWKQSIQIPTAVVSQSWSCCALPWPGVHASSLCQCFMGQLLAKWLIRSQLCLWSGSSVLTSLGSHISSERAISPTIIQLCWNGCGSRAGGGTLHLAPSNLINHRAV